MGLLVTLYLISSNVYSSVSAPKKRGFSYMEVWIMGSQGTILLAIIEYGFILMWKKFENKASSEVSPIVDKDEEKMWKNLSLNEKIKRVDIISIIVSGMFFLLFNIIYWIHTSMIWKYSILLKIHVDCWIIRFTWGFLMWNIIFYHYLKMIAIIKLAVIQLKKIASCNKKNQK